MSQSTEENINIAEAVATDAVQDSDILVSEQSTGYAAYTPEQAEAIARDAVINAINTTAQQIQGNVGYSQVDQAEQNATQAVAATDFD